MPEKWSYRAVEVRCQWIFKSFKTAKVTKMLQYSNADESFAQKHFRCIFENSGTEHLSEVCAAVCRDKYKLHWASWQRYTGMLQRKTEWERDADNPANRCLGAYWNTLAAQRIGIIGMEVLIETQRKWAMCLVSKCMTLWGSTYCQKRGE